MPKPNPCRWQAAALEDMPVADIPQRALSNFCSEQDQEAMTAVLPFLSESYAYQAARR